jgi:hypothetical protein
VSVCLILLSSPASPSCLPFVLTLLRRRKDADGREVTYSFDIDFHHLKEGKGDEEWENKYCVDARRVGNVSFLWSAALSY